MKFPLCCAAVFPGSSVAEFFSRGQSFISVALPSNLTLCEVLSFSLVDGKGTTFRKLCFHKQTRMTDGVQINGTQSVFTPVSKNKFIRSDATI